MALLGYFAAFFIGVSLGLIGGGGSILTVPVLVYLFGISPLTATSYSLLVVGLTSLAGSMQAIKKKLVDFKTGLLFGIPSIITVFLTRKVLLPKIPPAINVNHHQVPFAIITMLLFALLMLAASFSMIGNRAIEVKKQTTGSFVKLLLSGVGIGLVTGFLGAGGGFLLIPALVILLKVPMKTAIGTSLFIIAINSLIGFVADAGLYKTDYRLLFTIILIAIAGVYAGGKISRRVDARMLKLGFGWFVMAMGIFILVKELLMLR